MDDEEYEPSIGEQASFCEAHYLIRRLVNTTNFSISDIGRGVLGAAVSCLRKEIPDEKIARIMHAYADDYATRTEPPLVCRRAFCSNVKRLYRAFLCLHSMCPLLRLV